jgi:hypothetical protein
MRSGASAREPPREADGWGTMFFFGSAGEMYVLYSIRPSCFITGSGWYLYERGKKRDDTETDKSGFYVLCNDALRTKSRETRVAKKQKPSRPVARGASLPTDASETETAFILLSAVECTLVLVHSYGTYA